MLNNDWLIVALKTHLVANFIRRRGIKSLLFAIDNLWLYNFHQQEFDGTTRSVLETIAFFEEKKWEIVRLEEIKEDLETSIERLSEYNPNSNPTYLKKERKPNLFIASTMEYFVCSCLPPWSLSSDATDTSTSSSTPESAYSRGPTPSDGCS